MTTTPRTWVVGEVVSAALLNTEIRDQLNSFFGAWTDYTPSWIAETGGTPTIGNGTLTGRFLKIGRTVDFLIRLAYGSTSTPGNANANWAFGLPPSSTPSSAFNGARAANVSARLSGAGEVRGSGEISTTNSNSVRNMAGGSVNGTTNQPDNSFWDQTNPLTAAAGMIMHIVGRYEATS
ncbi:hypothetical protein [Streptomyces sp. NPDC047070]|uniref:hypothetical protein n=1 Tax=Streptomyces sp. NPDC047070 TaxID=3154923 RepID=UPI00345555C8